jgi:hypothetical protein
MVGAEVDAEIFIRDYGLERHTNSAVVGVGEEEKSPRNFTE